MPVTEQDVRHVAGLARLPVDEAKLQDLVTELNGILAHMEALSQVDTTQAGPSAGAPGPGTPLRSDSSGPLPLLAPLESFAPLVRDGFFIVPRLSTHDDGAGETP